MRQPMIDDTLYLVQRQWLNSHFDHSGHVIQEIMKFVRVINFCVSFSIVFNGVEGGSFFIVDGFVGLVRAVYMKEKISNQNKNIYVSEDLPISL